MRAFEFDADIASAEFFRRNERRARTAEGVEHESVCRTKGGD